MSGARDAAGFPPVPAPPVRAGAYYSDPYGFVTTSFAVTANRLYLVPFLSMRDAAYDRVACNIASGSGNVRLGVYSLRPDGLVGGLVADCGAAAVSAGIIEAAARLVLRRGWYFLAAVFDSTPSVSRIKESADVLGGGLGFATAASTNPATGFYAAHTYGALPLGPVESAALTALAANAPRLCLRAV